MKTLSRLVRRYVTAAFILVLSLALLNTAALTALLVRYGLQRAGESGGVSRLRDLSDCFEPDAQGAPSLPDADAALSGYAFAMLLSDDGDILWRWNLPERYDHRYGAREIAQFARWYLGDYPVVSYVNDYGLFVTALPQGSLIRHNMYTYADLFANLLSSVGPLLAADAALIVAVCLLLGYRSAKPLRVVGAGIDALAAGEPVSLPERGITAELAGKLNRASAHLLRQREAIARRDSARTDWIAGVSHDIRTPLAVITAQAEGLRDGGDEPARARAGSILRQSARIASLIGDLNLTSKLQYGAQPLRRRRALAGPLVRELTAELLNQDGAPQNVTLSVSPEAERAALLADAPLLGRALGNLLMNAARHAPESAVRVTCAVRRECLTLDVRDDGPGYPSAVLRILRDPSGVALSEPHILGLRIVRQIAEAHGGSVAFQNDPSAHAEIALPLCPENAGA